MTPDDARNDPVSRNLWIPLSLDETMQVLVPDDDALTMTHQDEDGPFAAVPSTSRPRMTVWASQTHTNAK